MSFSTMVSNAQTHLALNFCPLEETMESSRKLTHDGGLKWIALRGCEGGNVFIKAAGGSIIR